MSKKTTNDFLLEKIYGDNLARLKNLFKTYKHIYNLKEFVHKDEDVLPDAFEYAKKRRYFIILVLYTEEGYVCFQRSFDDGHLSMNLPGGSIRLEKEDTIITAIERVAERNFKNAKIADIAPIISLINRFHSKTGDIVEHYGFGIRARLLNDIQDIKNVSRNFIYKGRFLKEFPVEAIPHRPAQETYKIFKNWFDSKPYTTYTNEIRTQHQVIKRYAIHQKVVNPVIKSLSSIFGQISIKELKKAIYEKIGKIDKAVDIACGDDRYIFNLMKEVNLLVANDISVDQIENMQKLYYSRYSKHSKSQSLIFTNHDCLDLPFGDNAFDIAICGNLLHHMNSSDDLKTLFHNLIRVAKKILIVEIQDPQKENILGRLRHQYYIRFLKDEGKNFYSQKDFEQTIRKGFDNCEIEIDYMSTIRGLYMLAEIVKLRRDRRVAC